MKIRIKGNSVRYRLTRSEVERFGRDGYLEESTHFADSTLVYALQRSNNAGAISATFAENRITMQVPAAMAAEWVANEVVGYSNDIGMDNGNTLFVLLEKDFKCTDTTVTEDQSDNYEHPTKVC